MGILHFLNVLDGDCSIIQHPSGHTTVVDVCNASVESIVEGLVGIPLNPNTDSEGNRALETGTSVLPQRERDERG